MMEYQGHVAGGVIVLDEGANLPEGTLVRIEPVMVQQEQPPSTTQRRTLYERLEKFAGIIDDLPEDLAAQHDHYVHGTPKQ